MNDDSTCQANGELQFLMPAPHPTRGKRAVWKGEFTPLGPIGHLIRAIHFSGAKLNPKFEIIIFNEAHINILEVPYQHLHSIILQVHSRARTKAAEGTRCHNCELHEIDSMATCASSQKFTASEISYLHTIQTMSDWSKHELSLIGMKTNSTCDLCGMIHEDTLDLIWNPY